MWKENSFLEGRVTLKISKMLTAGLVDRRPLLPSPSISQLERSKMETWRRDLNKLTT